MPFTLGNYVSNGRVTIEIYSKGSKIKIGASKIGKYAYITLQNAYIRIKMHIKYK